VPNESIKPKRLFDSQRLGRSSDARPVSKNEKLRRSADVAGSNFMKAFQKYGKPSQVRRKKAKLEL
jgi:hypothetical protein